MTLPPLAPVQPKNTGIIITRCTKWIIYSEQGQNRIDHEPKKDSAAPFTLKAHIIKKNAQKGALVSHFDKD